MSKIFNKDLPSLSFTDSEWSVMSDELDSDLEDETGFSGYEYPISLNGGHKTGRKGQTKNNISGTVVPVDDDETRLLEVVNEKIGCFAFVAGIKTKIRSALSKKQIELVDQHTELKWQPRAVSEDRSPITKADIEYFNASQQRLYEQDLARLNRGRPKKQLRKAASSDKSSSNKSAGTFRFQRSHSIFSDLDSGESMDSAVMEYFVKEQRSRNVNRVVMEKMLKEARKNSPDEIRAMFPGKKLPTFKTC